MQMRGNIESDESSRVKSIKLFAGDNLYSLEIPRDVTMLDRLRYLFQVAAAGGKKHSHSRNLDNLIS